MSRHPRYGDTRDLRQHHHFVLSADDGSDKRVRAAHALVKLKGSVSINGTTYYTAAGATPLSTDSAMQDYVTINFPIGGAHSLDSLPLLPPRDASQVIAVEAVEADRAILASVDGKRSLQEIARMVAPRFFQGAETSALERVRALLGRHLR